MVFSIDPSLTHSSLYPQSLSGATLRLVSDSLDAPHCGALAILVLAAVAAKRPADVALYDDVIIGRMRADETAAAQGGQVLVTLSALSEVGVIMTRG